MEPQPTARIQPRVTADKEVSTEDACAPTLRHTCSETLITSKALPLLDLSALQQNWAAFQTVKRKRGRKPKLLMGGDPNRAHKDERASEKQEIREDKSDSESSDHGESQQRSHTRIVLCVKRKKCSSISLEVHKQLE